MPRTRMGVDRGCAFRRGAAIIRGSPGVPRHHSEQRNRMPSVKVRENEPFQFALRRFKRTCGEAGVLAETRKREFYEKPHAGTQAQGRRRGEAPGPSHLARRHQAPAPVLIPLGAPALAARSRRPAAHLARRRFAFPTTPMEPAMSLKNQLTDDMKSAMKAGEKERLGVIRLINAAIKQKKSTSASNSTTRRCSPSSTRWSSSAAIRCRSTTPPAARTWPASSAPRSR